MKSCLTCTSHYFAHCYYSSPDLFWWNRCMSNHDNTNSSVANDCSDYHPIDFYLKVLQIKSEN